MAIGKSKYTFQTADEFVEKRRKKYEEIRRQKEQSASQQGQSSRPGAGDRPSYNFSSPGDSITEGGVSSDWGIAPQEKVFDPQGVARNAEIAHAATMTYGSPLESMQRSINADILNERRTSLKNDPTQDVRTQRLNELIHAQKTSADSDAAQEPMTDIGYVARKTGQGIGSFLSGVGDLIRIGQSKDREGSRDFVEQKSLNGSVSGSMDAAMNVFDVEMVKRIAEDNGITEDEAWDMYINAPMAKEGNIKQTLRASRPALEAEAENHGKAARAAGAVGEAIGGIAIPAAVSMLPYMKKAGTVLMSASAGGASGSEAYDNGASINEAFNNAALTGAKEFVIENLFSGPLGLGEGNFLGKGLSYVKSKIPKTELVKKLSEIGDVGVIKYIGKALGEGAEEVFSTYLQSYVDEATWADEAERATLRELVQSFGLGAAVSLVLGVPVAFDNNGRMHVEEQKKESTTPSVSSVDNDAAGTTTNEDDVLAALINADGAPDAASATTEQVDAAETEQKTGDPELEEVIQQLEDAAGITLDESNTAEPALPKNTSSVFSVSDIKQQQNDPLKDKVFLAYARGLGYTQKLLKNEPQTLKAVYSGYLEERNKRADAPKTGADPELERLEQELMEAVGITSTTEQNETAIMPADAPPAQNKYNPFKDRVFLSYVRGRNIPLSELKANEQTLRAVYREYMQARRGSGNTKSTLPVIKEGTAANEALAGENSLDNLNNILAKQESEKGDAPIDQEEADLYGSSKKLQG